MGRNGPNRSVLLVGGPLQIGDPDDSFDKSLITRRSKTTSFLGNGRYESDINAIARLYVSIPAPSAVASFACSRICNCIGRQRSAVVYLIDLLNET